MRLLRPVLFACGFALIAPCALSAAPARCHQPPIPKIGAKESILYSKIRPRLVTAGYQPAVPKAEIDPDPCGYYLSDQKEVCEKYPETERCAPTGEGNCQFLWKDIQGNVLFLAGLGDGDPRTESIVGWTVTCATDINKGISPY